MIWREYIAQLVPQSAPPDSSLTAVFYPPASPQSLTDAELALGTPLPSELKAVLAETNGVTQHLTTPHVNVDIGYLLWSIEQIQEQNVMFRTTEDFKALYMPFDCLLFFADTGNGDQFAYTVLDGQVRRPDIFGWNHENDSRTWVAPSLELFLAWWAEGKITT